MKRNYTSTWEHVCNEFSFQFIEPLLDLFGNEFEISEEDVESVIYTFVILDGVEGYSSNDVTHQGNVLMFAFLVTF